MTSLIRSAQNNTRQNPNMDGVGTHKIQHLTGEILMTDCCKERESQLFSRMSSLRGSLSSSRWYYTHAHTGSTKGIRKLKKQNKRIGRSGGGHGVYWTQTYNMWNDKSL